MLRTPSNAIPVSIQRAENRVHNTNCFNFFAFLPETIIPRLFYNRPFQNSKHHLNLVVACGGEKRREEERKHRLSPHFYAFVLETTTTDRYTITSFSRHNHNRNTVKTSSRSRPDTAMRRRSSFAICSNFSAFVLLFLVHLST